MSLVAKILNRVAEWALAQNPRGGYVGENDKRWAYTIETDGQPYLTRILLPRFRIPFTTREVRPVLHHFHRPDMDRYPHDHPWDRSLSIILSGSYLEERVDQVVEVPARDATLCGQRCDITACQPDGRTRREVLTDTKTVRWWNALTKEDFHRVLKLNGDVWTLFFMGTRVQGWGFLVDGVKVPWREYLSNLDTISSADLDAVGKKWGVVRRAWNDTDGTDYWNAVEPDADYRERIRAAMRSEEKTA